MRRFQFGFTLTLFIIAGWAMIAPRWSVWGASDDRSLVAVLLSVLVLPTVASWLAIELLHVIRPRRLFMGRPRAGALLASLGAGSAVLAMAISAVGMAFLSPDVPAAVLTSSAAALVSFVVVASLPRRKPGYCLYCGYDLRGGTVETGPRCTECGREQPD